MSKKKKKQRLRVLIHPKHWTPVNNQVIRSVFPVLRQRLAAVVYAVLYDAAWHNRHRGIVKITLSQLAGKIGIDVRTAQKCVTDLEDQSFLVRVRPGKFKSRTKKPVWRVPFACYSSLKAKGFTWFPVPRFIFHRYFVCSPRTVLLLPLACHQHLSWKNYSWVGAPKLSKLMNWSLRRTYDALQELRSSKRWAPNGNGLPRPLSVVKAPPDKTWTSRHHRVRALEYIRPAKGTKSAPVVTIRQEFRTHFNIQ